MEPNEQDGQMPSQPVAQAPLPQTNFELSISAVLTNCWGYFTQNMGVYLGLYAASLVLSLIVTIPVFIVLFSSADTTTTGQLASSQDFNVGTFVAAMIVAVIASIAVSSRIIASMYAVSLHIMRDGGKPTFGEAWSMGKPHFMRVLSVTLVSGLAVVLGFFALVIPGVLLLLGLFVTGPAAVDKNLGVGDSFRESMRLTKGKWLWLLGLLVVVMLVSSMLSIIPIIGQIASAVLGLVLWIMPVYVYMGLKQEKDSLNMSAHQAGMPETGVVGMPAPSASPSPDTVVDSQPDPEVPTPPDNTSTPPPSA